MDQMNGRTDQMNGPMNGPMVQMNGDMRCTRGLCVQVKDWWWWHGAHHGLA